MLEYFDDIPSLIVLNETNNCIEQEQAGNDSQIDPVSQSSSQYKRQLSRSCQLKTDSSRGYKLRRETGSRGMDLDLQA